MVEAERPELLFTIFYIIASFCFVAPPIAFKSAGLTVQNLFSSYLGNEELEFIGFHVKRTTITLVVHSVIPLGYYVGFGLLFPHHHLFEPGHFGLMPSLYLLFCSGLALWSAGVAFYWSSNKWKNHPLCRVLANHGGTWRAVASNINIEFRRIGKFSSIIGGTSIYVTDSWVIKCSTYSVDIAHQPDIHLSIENEENHEISHEHSSGVQFLNIRVSSINPVVKSFIIRLNAIEYGDLREKLLAPIRNARNVVIRQSLSDRFLDAFRNQVQLNEVYRLPQEYDDSEMCIGCMVNPSNVKLQKCCAASNEGECRMCFCRPMWCLECMGKWFASRQDQQTPEMWLSGISPCPTCRAKFCMLDVSVVVR